MDLPELESFLDSPNPQLRMKAITELRHHEPEIVVPLLKRRMYDEQFMIRSFVAMGFGYKRNHEAYEALLDIVQHETDHNVVAEAANSLSKFGDRAIPHLLMIFEQQPHWLIRQSIFAAMDTIDAPEVLLRLCRLGFDGEDITVQMAAIVSLTKLKDTDQAIEALEILEEAAIHSNPLIRAKAARVLQHLGGTTAQRLLAKLQQDSDYRVIGAVLEGLL